MRAMRFGMLLTFAGLALAAGGCSDGTGLNAGQVALKFRTEAGAQASIGPAALGAAAAPQALTIEGTNGTLTITEVRMIVAEFELEQEDDACSSGPGNTCAEFDARPFFLNLPVDAGGEVTVASDAVPAGTYHEFEFEVEDLDDDEEDDDAAAIAAVMVEVRAAFPNWPKDASVIVIGTFTPADGGAAQPFTVFVDAEIEIEMDLNPPLVVPGDQGLVVNVMPTLWFKRPDGSVLNLALFDFEATGRVLQLDLEVEFRNGFTQIEVED